MLAKSLAMEWADMGILVREAIVPFLEYTAHSKPDRWTIYLPATSSESAAISYRSYGISKVKETDDFYLLVRISTQSFTQIPNWRNFVRMLQWSSESVHPMNRLVSLFFICLNMLHVSGGVLFNQLEVLIEYYVDVTGGELVVDGGVTSWWKSTWISWFRREDSSFARGVGVYTTTVQVQ